MAAADQEGEVEWELCNEGGDPTEGRPVGHAPRDEEQDPQPHPPPSQEFLPMMDEMILEIFKSREDLIKWTREAGKRNGFVIVIKTSDAGCNGKRPRVTFGCERGGYYTGKNIEGQTEKRLKSTGTKKCGCPFTLKGKKLATDDDWMLKVVCGNHNHPAAEHLKGHSYAGRLNQEETSFLVDMSKSLVRPKTILNTLKERDPLNAATIKTIYNARQKYKVAEKAERLQMKYLMSILSEHKYIEWHRNCDNTETVTDLFFAHPTSVDLLRTFPCILIMDCTYKTNRYRLPLLEIVGVTSTNMTFSVAFAYLESEREDNYAWALGRLRTLMDDGELPGVIVTNRDLALMNAIGRVFPTARHLLCRCHISENVLAKCKKMFDMEEKWDKFIMSWNILVLSSTEDEYNQYLGYLYRDFSSYTQALEYVTCTWLNPYKDRFVAAWTDTCMHCGNVTMNRAVSAHAKLKRQLGSSQDSFESSWPKIHALLELQHTDIKASFEKSLTIVQHNFKLDEFKELRGFISTSALEMVLAQFKHANSIGVNPAACGCVIRHTHGLPCAHEIAEYKMEGRPIPLGCIDVHWKKLNIMPMKQVKVLSCQPELDLISKHFEDSDTATKLQVIKKLKEIICPETTFLVEPEVKTKTRGRPPEKIDMSTPRDPSSFELVASGQDSDSSVLTGATVASSGGRSSRSISSGYDKPL